MSRQLVELCSTKESVTSLVGIDPKLANNLPNELQNMLTNDGHANESQHSEL
jgi:hypothetical protein